MNIKSPDSVSNSQSPSKTQQTYHDGERAMLRKRVFKRLRRVSPEKIVNRSLERGRKWQQLRRTAHPSVDKVPVFIVGCNRSGTNMVCGAIGNSPHGWDFRESSFSVAFNGYYLREDWIIERLIRRIPAPIISFGSILDSQSTRRFALAI